MTNLANYLLVRCIKGYGFGYGYHKLLSIKSRYVARVDEAIGIYKIQTAIPAPSTTNQTKPILVLFSMIFREVFVIYRSLPIFVLKACRYEFILGLIFFSLKLYILQDCQCGRHPFFI
ncbi:hypothetical protein ABFX02_12G115100 [Erythranthe guttata]